MTNIIQGNINFTVNNTEAVGGFGHKRTHGSLIKNNKYDFTTKQLLINNHYESYGGFSINSIDIDWNNAELPNADTANGGLKTITNSGELLKLINNIQNEIYILTDIIFNKISNYYWYVGVVTPTDPNNSTQNTGNNKWTILSAQPPQIAIETEFIMPPTTWYVLIPHSYGFQAYDSTGSSPDTVSFSKTITTINGIQYDLFTGINLVPRINVIFKI